MFLRYGGSSEHLLGSPQDGWGSRLAAPRTDVRRHPTGYPRRVTLQQSSLPFHRLVAVYHSECRVSTRFLTPPPDAWPAEGDSAARHAALPARENKKNRTKGGQRLRS